MGSGTRFHLKPSMTVVAPAAEVEEEDRPFIPSRWMLSKVVPSSVWLRPNSWLVMAKPRTFAPRGGECLWDGSLEAGTQQPPSAGRKLDSCLAGCPPPDVTMWEPRTL